MRAGLLVSAALVVAAGGVQAQVVVANDTLPAEKQVVRDILLQQRDSLHTILAAAAQLRRDHATASNELTFSRGRTFLRGCRRSLATIDPTRSTIAASDWDDEYQNGRRDELIVEMEVLNLALGSCDEEWSQYATPTEAEQIRTTGLMSADSLVAIIHQYENVVAAYYKVLDIRVQPPGGSSRSIP